MRLTEQITYKGVELSVTGDYQKAQYNSDPDTPDEPHQFECSTIEWNGMDVFDIFDAMNVLDEIDKEVLKKK
jgi:hypothetical protein